MLWRTHAPAFCLVLPLGAGRLPEGQTVSTRTLRIVEE